MPDGRGTIRAAMRNRNRVGAALSGLKDELRVPMDRIHAYIAGDDGALTANQLMLATTWLWGGAVEYEPEGNLLRSANRAEPTSMGVSPQSFPRKPDSEIVRAGSGPAKDATPGPARALPLEPKPWPLRLWS